MADPVQGGWHPELDDTLTPRPRFFKGKPDIYHLLQSFLIPLYPADGSLGEMVRRAAVSLKRRTAPREGSRSALDH